MAQDPGIAFTQNLVNKYMQFKLYQFQVELDERREKRYDRQLELDRERNRLYAMNIKSVIAARENPKRGTMSVFSPTQVTGGLQDIIEEEFAGTTPSDRGFLRGVQDTFLPKSWESADKISAEETTKAIERIRARVGYEFLDEAKRAQIDASIDKVVRGGFTPSGGRKTTIEPPAFREAQTGEDLSDLSDEELRRIVGQ